MSERKEPSAGDCYFVNAPLFLVSAGLYCVDFLHSYGDNVFLFLLYFIVICLFSFFQLPQHRARQARTLFLSMSVRACQDVNVHGFFWRPRVTEGRRPSCGLLHKSSLVELRQLICRCLEWIAELSCQICLSFAGLSAKGWLRLTLGFFQFARLKVSYLRRHLCLQRSTSTLSAAVRSTFFSCQWMSDIVPSISLFHYYDKGGCQLCCARYEQLCHGRCCSCASPNSDWKTFAFSLMLFISDVQVSTV